MTDKQDKHADNPIRKRRREMGLTIRGLAELAGIPTGTFADAERGRCGISAKNSEKLAAVFQCDAEELVKETEAYAKQVRMKQRKATAAQEALKKAEHKEKTLSWHEWEEMTEMKRGGNRANGLDMRLVNERNPMKSLKALREKARMTVFDAAQRAGIPAYQWEGLEKGETKPDIRTARRIAAMFKTEWCWIFQEVVSC